jgi:uncharacterized protein (TIGR03083 family)
MPDDRCILDARATNYARGVTESLTAESSHAQSRGARLLLTERDAILPILRSLRPNDFDRPTVLPGWSVRDVVAHCAAALGMAAAGTGHGFSPEENQRDVDDRKPLPIQQVLDELETNYAAGAAVIAAAEGKLDRLALGEWLHGGDVRDALGIETAYASDGLHDAVTLFEELSRRPRAAIPLTQVELPLGTLRLGSEPSELSLGADATHRRYATLETDAVTLVRLLGGRTPDPGRYRLTGADPIRYVMFH